jgi:hypothetical protein
MPFLDIGNGPAARLNRIEKIGPEFADILVVGFIECGEVRRWVPTWTTRFAPRAARTIAWPSPIVCAIGFST